MAELKPMKMCAGCGTPFTPLADEDFCYKCRNTTSTKEADVIDYIRDNPGVSILDVSRRTKLSKNTLIKMAHEGRFAGLILNKDFGYPCPGCGKLITFGTYCPECFSDFKKNAKNAKNADFLAKAKAAQQSKDKSRTFSHGMQDEIKSRTKNIKQ